MIERIYLTVIVLLMASSNVVAIGDGPYPSEGGWIFLIAIVVLVPLGIFSLISWLVFKFKGRSTGKKFLVISALVVISIVVIFNLYSSYSQKQYTLKDLSWYETRFCNPDITVDSRYSESYRHFLAKYERDKKNSELLPEHTKITSCLAKSDLVRETSFDQVLFELAIKMDNDAAMSTLYELMRKGNEEAARYYLKLTGDGCFYYHQEKNISIPFDQFCQKGKIKNATRRDIERLKDCINGNYNEACYTDKALAIFSNSSIKETAVKLILLPEHKSVPFSLSGNSKIVLDNAMTDDHAYVFFTHTRGNHIYTYHSDTEAHGNYYIKFEVIEINLDELPPHKHP